MWRCAYAHAQSVKDRQIDGTNEQKRAYGEREREQERAYWRWSFDE